MAFVEIRNLSRKFGGRYVLKNISLSFPSTGLYVIKGENRCGKSTLLEIMALLDMDYEGSVRIEGKELRNLKERKIDGIHLEKIAYVSQRDGFVPFFTDKENVDLVPSFDKGQKKESGMSTGEMMMKVLERDLKPGKSLYLLDEITANLDLENSQKVIERIKKLSETSLIILVTHSEKLLDIADGSFSLREGVSLNYVGKETSFQTCNHTKRRSLSLLFKGALKSTWQNLLFSFIFYFLFCVLFEAIVALQTYNFKTKLVSLLHTDDRALISESAKEANELLEGEKYQYDGLLAYSDSIPDDGKIHVPSSLYNWLSLLNGGTLPSLLNNDFFIFNAFEFIVGDSVPFMECFANPNIKSHFDSSNINGGFSISNLNVISDGNCQIYNSVVFCTVDSMKRADANVIVKSYSKLLTSLDDNFSLSDDEVLFTDQAFQDCLISFEKTNMMKAFVLILKLFFQKVPNL